MRCLFIVDKQKNETLLFIMSQMSHLALKVVHLELELMGLKGTRPASSANQCTHMTETPGKAQQYLQKRYFKYQTLVPHAHCPDKCLETVFLGEL